jgi:hypothetical protein
MRQRSYYSIADVTTGLYTFGGEWMYADGTEYIGAYHTYNTGESYTQPSWNDSSIKLVLYEDITSSTYRYKQTKTIETKFDSFTSKKLNITKHDVDMGVVNRYFIKKINEPMIYEIGQTDYNKWTNKQLDTNLYVAVELPWAIAGPIEDTYVNGVMNIGVVTYNTRQVKLAEQTIPTISDHLSNLTEYYMDTTYTVAKDING